MANTALNQEPHRIFDDIPIHVRFLRKSDILIPRSSTIQWKHDKQRCLFVWIYCLWNFDMWNPIQRNCHQIRNFQRSREQYIPSWNSIYIAESLSRYYWKMYVTRKELSSIVWRYRWIICMFHIQYLLIYINSVFCGTTRNTWNKYDK